ncbi:N-acetyltransferase [Nannocystis sp. SCPEA4]|uniref:GNAT family N-acetyltransferase n=1 Tax=Nannocystis sp. SCPEA4 TaxID=2996787 RepID=UPI00226D9701|nr:N-acetyltransferase [Nannocystis sp. SCPEA4]MCY1053622.1 N-acetyltransferase [Nannocystis sp. SCPEA4]
MHFRPATSSDVPAILDMMEDFNRLEHIPWQRGPGEAPLRTLIGSPALGTVGLAVEGDAALGYYILTWGFDLEWGGRDAFLTELYLRPELRGGGRGRLVLDAALATARAHDARAIHLMVRTDNTPALQLYRSAGFSAPPRVLMTRPLD